MLRREFAGDSLVVRVGMRIRRLRMERGISLRDFGKRAGVHPFHVMAVELGQLATTTKTLGAIAKALGVTPVDLLNYDSENDDMEYIVEAMRKRPECVGEVMARVRRYESDLSRKERISSIHRTSKFSQ